MRKMKFMAAAAAAMMGLTAVTAGFPAMEASAADDSALKIMCVGDSITHGYNDSNNGYRKYLCYYLQQQGIEYDMVGIQNSWSNEATYNWNGTTITYDPAHCGYSGYAIQAYSGRSGIYDVLFANGNQVENYDPDMILLQIGTNDLLDARLDVVSGQSDLTGSTSALDRLETLVDKILESSDSTDTLFLASVPYIDTEIRSDWLGAYGYIRGVNTSDPDALAAEVYACVDEYNAGVKALVAEKAAAGYNVQFGDINSVVDVKAGLHDGCHPNEVGYAEMGLLWANTIGSYLGENPIVTAPTTTTTTTTTTAAETEPVVTTATEAEEEVVTTTTTTTTPAPTTTTTTTTTTKVTVPVSEGDIILDDVVIGENYDLSAYAGMGIEAISFVFDKEPPYGMNGCVALGNWELQKNYTFDDLTDLTLTVELDKDYSSMVIHKWYGDTDLSHVVLHVPGSGAEIETDTTTEETTTTTTTTTTPAPTTTTTTTTTPAPTTTTTTTTTPAPTTTTTTTTTPAPTTTTTTTTTPAPTTTTTTTPAPETDENCVVLTDVVIGESYSLADYDYNSISKIVIKWNGDAGYGFGGALILGNWIVQNSYSHDDLAEDGTMEFIVDNPQDKLTLFRYWGTIELESITLYF